MVVKVVAVLVARVLLLQSSWLLGMLPVLLH